MCKFIILTLFFIIFTTINGQLPFNATCNAKTERRVCGHNLFCNLTRTDSNSTGVCVGCESSTQCQTFKQISYDCMPVVDKHGTRHYACQHKNLFPRLTLFDIFSAILTFIGGILASASGAGGGGIFVPIFNSVGQFPPKLAIPLSNAMIFGSAIANNFILSQTRHPRANRPLIDYSLALLFEPCTLIGTIIGVFFNTIFPDWLVLTLLVISLGSMSLRMFIKAIQLFRKESEKISKNSEETSELLFEQTLTLESSEGLESENELRKIIEAESKTPWLKLFVVLLCWVIVSALSILKGGQNEVSVIGIKPCSWEKWLITFLNFPIVGGIVFLCAIWIYMEFKKKMSLGYKLQEGDIIWNFRNLILYPLLTTIAGVMAGLLGIGGGIVKGPLLLEMGVLPEVTAATCSFMILFTSSITTVQYLVLGRLPYDYGIFFAVLGFFAGLIGQVGMDYVVSKLKRVSLLVFSLAMVIASSTVLMTGLGLYNLIRDINDGVYLGFQKPCG